MPHKYHPLTIAKSLLEIAKGKETRKGMATQVVHMASLRDRIHVLEGSIEFRLLRSIPIPAQGARYSFVWWGIQETPKD